MVWKEARSQKPEARSQKPEWGFPMLASGFWLLASGFWLLASGFRLPASGFLASGFLCYDMQAMKFETWSRPNETDICSDLYWSGFGVRRFNGTAAGTPASGADGAAPESFPADP